MRDEIKKIYIILIILLINLLIWYLIFAFVDAQFNVWKWHGFVRGLYISISFLTFIQSAKEFN